MANIPSRFKFRKRFKLLTNNIAKASSNVDLAFGDYGLRAIEFGRITEKQIEACRKAMVKEMKRQGSIIKKMFPHWSVTKKALAVRMGKGKGSVDHYANIVRSGNIIFELDGVEDKVARKALELAQYKLPFKTRIVSRLDFQAC